MKNLFLATSIALASFSVQADDKAIGLNFLFNSKGFQGVQLQGSIDKMEVHGALLKDNQFAVGAGYRALDTEGNGTRNDDDLSASLAVGGAYIGGTNAGFRPYGQVDVEVAAGGNTNLSFGAIDYGLGMTEATSGYGYVGVEYEDLEDNDRPAPQAVQTASQTTNSAGESDDDSGNVIDTNNNVGLSDTDSNNSEGSGGEDDSGENTGGDNDSGDDGTGSGTGSGDGTGDDGGVTPPIDPPAPPAPAVTGLGGGQASETGNAKGGPHANENAFKPNPGRGGENRNK